MEYESRRQRASLNMQDTEKGKVQRDDSRINLKPVQAINCPIHDNKKRTKFCNYCECNYFACFSFPPYNLRHLETLYKWQKGCRIYTLFHSRSDNDTRSERRVILRNFKEPLERSTTTKNETKKYQFDSYIIYQPPSKGRF